jgi:hypothetical protein
MQAGWNYDFVINANPLPSITVNLTANKDAPQLPGTRIQFTAFATSVGVIQYKWWVFDGATWTVVQDWSTSNRFFWMPATFNPNYKVMVRAQLATNPSVSAGASLAFPISAWKTRR